MKKLSEIEHDLVRTKIYDISTALAGCSSRITLLVGEAYVLKATIASLKDTGLKIESFGVPELRWARLLPIPKARNFVVRVSKPTEILGFFDLLDESPLHMMIISMDASYGDLCLKEVIALSKDIWLLDKTEEVITSFSDSFIYHVNTDSSRFDGIEEIVHWNIQTPIELLQASGVLSGEISLKKSCTT